MDENHEPNSLSRYEVLTIALTILFGIITVFGAAPAIVRSFQDPKDAALLSNISYGIIGVIVAVGLYIPFRRRHKRLKEQLALSQRELNRAQTQLEEIQDSLTLAQEDVSTQGNYLSHLLGSLPILFQKTLHVRQTLSPEKLDAYRKSIRQGEESVPDFASSYVIGNSSNPVISEGIRKLLQDLKLAIAAVTEVIDVVCSVKVLNGNGFKSVFGTDPIADRRREEDAYLANDDIQNPKTTVGRVWGTSMACLNTADEISNMSDEIAEHIRITWPKMPERIQSLILCPITVENGGKTECIGMLQVDSPSPNQFETQFDRQALEIINNYTGDSAIVEMAKCTAEAIGAVISVSLYINDRFEKTMAIESERSALSRQIAELDGKIDILIDRIDRATSDRIDLEKECFDREQQLHNLKINLKKNEQKHNEIEQEYTRILEEVVEQDISSCLASINEISFERNNKKEMIAFIESVLNSTQGKARKKLSDVNSQMDNDTEGADGND